MSADSVSKSWPSGERIVVPHDSTIEPGHFVRHPQQPDWGVGQVQSVIDGRITVNFEHAGKVLINGHIVSLAILHDWARPLGA